MTRLEYLNPEAKVQNLLSLQEKKKKKSLTTLFLNKLLLEKEEEEGEEITNVQNVCSPA